MNTYLQESCNSLILNDSMHFKDVSAKEIAEGRELYLDCLTRPNYTDSIKEGLVNPIIKKYNINSIENTLIKVKIIPKNNINKCYNRFITNNVFTCGRSQLCNLIIDDIDISRIHFFGMIIKNKIIIIDTWSLFGTTVYDNKNEYNEYNNYVTNRRILKFDKDKRCILELKNYIIILNSDKILNNKFCIVCMSAPRLIRNNCGHGILCQDCNKRLMLDNSDSECFICKKIIKKQYISNCLDTFKLDVLESNTL